MSDHSASHVSGRESLPAPGSLPGRRTPRDTVTILVIVTGLLVLLLSRGCSAGTALGVLAGVSAITCRLAGARPVTG